jgi:hypothetical protein
MRTLLLAVAAAVLAGCAAFEPTPSARMMKTAPGPDDAYVYVGVLVDSGGVRRLAVYPDSVLVGKKNVKIFWYLDAGVGYKFTADGIAVDDGRGDFDTCKGGKNGDVLDGGLTYRCHDNNHTKDETDFPRFYKYRIRVTGPGGPLELDPWVVNN